MTVSCGYLLLFRLHQAGATEPSMLVVGDLDDVFLPKPADILVNLVEAKAAVESLLTRLSDMFKDTHNVGNALGAALQAAFKLVVSSKRTVTAFECMLTTSFPVPRRRKGHRSQRKLAQRRTWCTQGS